MTVTLPLAHLELLPVCVYSLHQMAFVIQISKQSLILEELADRLLPNTYVSLEFSIMLSTLSQKVKNIPELLKEAIGTLSQQEKVTNHLQRKL